MSGWRHSTPSRLDRKIRRIIQLLPAAAAAALIDFIPSAALNELQSHLSKGAKTVQLTLSEVIH